MFLQIVNKHAPVKSKLLRTNHTSYISTPSRKAIMKKFNLENLNFKNRTDYSLKNYKNKKKLLQQTLQKMGEKTFLIS